MILSSELDYLDNLKLCYDASFWWMFDETRSFSRAPLFDSRHGEVETRIPYAIKLHGPARTATFVLSFGRGCTATTMMNENLLLLKHRTPRLWPEHKNRRFLSSVGTNRPTGVSSLKGICNRRVWLHSVSEACPSVLLRPLHCEIQTHRCRTVREGKQTVHHRRSLHKQHFALLSRSIHVRRGPS